MPNRIFNYSFVNDIQVISQFILETCPCFKKVYHVVQGGGKVGKLYCCSKNTISKAWESIDSHITFFLLFVCLFVCLFKSIILVAFKMEKQMEVKIEKKIK